MLSPLRATPELDTYFRRAMETSLAELAGYAAESGYGTLAGILRGLAYAVRVRQERVFADICALISEGIGPAVRRARRNADRN